MSIISIVTKVNFSAASHSRIFVNACTDISLLIIATASGVTNTYIFFTRLGTYISRFPAGKGNLDAENVDLRSAT